MSKLTKYLSLSSMFILVSCASMTMQSYVDKTIADAVLDYGMPSSAINMPNGNRAFIWHFTNTTTYAGATTVSGVVDDAGNIYADTYTSPSYSSTETCAYVLYAVHEGEVNEPHAWRVVGFKKPRLSCE